MLAEVYYFLALHSTRVPIFSSQGQTSGLCSCRRRSVCRYRSDVSSSSLVLCSMHVILRCFDAVGSRMRTVSKLSKTYSVRTDKFKDLLSLSPLIITNNILSGILSITAFYRYILCSVFITLYCTILSQSSIFCCNTIIKFIHSFSYTKKFFYRRAYRWCQCLTLLFKYLCSPVYILLSTYCRKQAEFVTAFIAARFFYQSLRGDAKALHYKYLCVFCCWCITESRRILLRFYCSYTESSFIGAYPVVP